MHAYKTETIVPQNHRLELTLPASFPTGTVEVIFLAKEDSPHTTAADTEPSRSLKAFSAWLKQQPATPRSREEIEAQIREERDSWGDA